jgi:hypothetical protein
MDRENRLEAFRAGLYCQLIDDFTHARNLENHYPVVVKKADMVRANEKI